MPELPEVETSVRGILPHLRHQYIKNMLVRQPALRWPIPKTLTNSLVGRQIIDVGRRGKYILIDTGGQGMLIHLGMSGSVRIVKESDPVRKHDHFDLILQNGVVLRYHDPRRFGCCLPYSGDPQAHELLKSLGVEPLSEDFDAEYLFSRSRGRQVAVKNFIMNSAVVVGVGNIYASEALFAAGIHPKRAAGRISFTRYRRLVAEIKDVLARAIKQGGSTLNDFVNADGNPGYFAQTLSVYGRAGQSCPVCQRPLKVAVIGQRSSFYCAQCQN